MNPQVDQNIPKRLTKHQIRKSMTYATASATAFLVSFSCLEGSVLTLVAIKLGAEEFIIGILTFAVSLSLVFSIFTINSVEKYGKKKVLIIGFSFAPNGQIFIANLDPHVDVTMDQQINMYLNTDKIHIFEPGDTGSNISL